MTVPQEELLNYKLAAYCLQCYLWYWFVSFIGAALFQGVTLNSVSDLLWAGWALICPWNISNHLTGTVKYLRGINNIQYEFSWEISMSAFYSLPFSYSNENHNFSFRLICSNSLGSVSSCDAFLSLFQSHGLKPEAICPCATSAEAMTVAIRRYCSGCQMLLMYVTTWMKCAVFTRWWQRDVN